MRSIRLLALVLVACGSKTPPPATAKAAPSSTPSASTSAAPAHPSALASAVKPPLPPPPSTGKEFVAPKIKVPTKDEARATLKTALEAAQKKDCRTALTPEAQTAFNFALVDAEYSKANLPGLLALARCDESVHFYHTLLNVSAAIHRSDPKFHPELLPRAMIGLGQNQAALTILLQEQKAAPKDGDISLTLAKAHCHLEDWANCLKVADDTLKLVGTPSDTEKKEIAWRADKYRARALLHTGKFDDASKAADDAEKLGAPVAELDQVKKEAVRGKTHKMLVEVSYGTMIPLGGYHLFGKLPSVGSIATVKLANLDTADHEVKIEIEITGATEKTTKTVTMLKGKQDTIELTPPLKTTFDINSIRADSRAQIALKITRTDTNAAVYDDSLAVTLMPRDSLPIRRALQSGEVRTTPEFLAAWITPNAKAVDSFLAAAKKRVANGAAFTGGQRETLPQVKAIYDELHERGMSYVMDPGLFVEGQLVQRTRLPSEVLESTNAQCIEGALLYATLFEAIGLKPIVTLASGHSWAGWKPEGHDKLPPKAPNLFWLETTVTHDYSFDQALAAGDKQYYVNHAADWIAPKGAAPQYFYVDIAGLRAKGATPQPWN